MSEFVLLFRTSEADRQRAMGNPDHAKQAMQAWLAWMRDLEDKGHLANPGQPLGIAGKVVRGAGKAVVSDGPYVEAKDIVLGFIVLEARDLAQAASLAKGCPMLQGEGCVEVRPVDDTIRARDGAAFRAQPRSA